MPGEWHAQWQAMFAKQHGEAGFSFVHTAIDDPPTKRARRADAAFDEGVIEYQHTRITREEASARSSDCEGRPERPAVWLIDCTGNVSPPVLISEPSDEHEVWVLEFEKAWHIGAMHGCAMLFADFGARIYRVPVDSVRHRLVKVYGSWTRAAFIEHAASGEIQAAAHAPVQSTLTVAQDPHGSGKTYRLTRMIIHAEGQHVAYATFIVVTKAHSAKEVVYSEFITHLQRARLEYREEECTNKYVVTFERTGGEKVMCIFGTVDSLMYCLAENKMKGADMFVNLVRTIHAHGASKLRGPKGGFRYAGERPRLNKRTLLVTDEATMLPEAYLDAFATLMATCHVDLHLAGDVQQSTFCEANLLTRVVGEYNEARAHGRSSLPSFPGCAVVMQCGNEVRRFNQDLVDFRNVVMAGFHEHPSHNLQIKVPVAATGMRHARGEYSLHVLAEKLGDRAHAIARDAELVMEQLEGDVAKYKLLPGDILLIAPFVAQNQLLDELQSRIHEFWSNTFFTDAYARALGERMPGETEEDVDDRARRYEDAMRTFSDDRSKALPWFCVLHRSEEGKPIDTRTSRCGTRLVSIHASQGDGRRVAYVVGLTESTLKTFSRGVANLMYESLLNVAVSRMKEVVRVFLERAYDDIWERFAPLMDESMKQCVVPYLYIPKSFRTSHMCAVDMSEALFSQVKEAVRSAQREAPSPCARVDRERPLVDDAHHTIRMCVANTVIWCNLVATQSMDKEHSEQVRTVFSCLARAEVRSYCREKYYHKLRHDTSTAIPILQYRSTHKFAAVHGLVVDLMREVQGHVRRWLAGERTAATMKPVHAVLLQYAVEANKLYWNESEKNIKMDHVYDVAHACTGRWGAEASELEAHYSYVSYVDAMYDDVVQHVAAHRADPPPAGTPPDAPAQWQWKVYRGITLGSKKTGHETQYFSFQHVMQHLVLAPTAAVPLLLCPSLDELSMQVVCARSLLSTLFCTQPFRRPSKGDDGVPTWKYVKDKEVRACIMPIQGARPVHVNLTAIVEANIQLVAEWLCDVVKQESESHISQVLAIVKHFDDFDDARDHILQLQLNERHIPAFIQDVFNTSDGAGRVEQELRDKLDEHLKTLMRDITRR